MGICDDLTDFCSISVFSSVKKYYCNHCNYLVPGEAHLDCVESWAMQQCQCCSPIAGSTIDIGSATSSVSCGHCWDRFCYLVQELSNFGKSLWFMAFGKSILMNTSVLLIV